MSMGLRLNCVLFLSHFNQIWIFSTDLRKTLKYQISYTSVQWEASCSMRTDGQTDGHNVANSRFFVTSRPRLKKKVRMPKIYSWWYNHSSIPTARDDNHSLKKAGWPNTGRFIMFSVITNIYNKKTKGSSLMEFFTATGKLIFFTTRYVRCVHQRWISLTHITGSVNGKFWHFRPQCKLT